MIARSWRAADVIRAPGNIKNFFGTGLESARLAMAFGTSRNAGVANLLHSS
jgi:hypothetical protein